MVSTERKTGRGAVNVGKSNCANCKKKVIATRKFCSQKCYWKSKVGMKNWWGYKIGDALRGIPKSKKHIESVSKALTGRKRPEITEDKHPSWKGDLVGYSALHDWVSRRLGNPKKCDICKTTDNVRFQWSNISRLYKRDLLDWRRLCLKCHRRSDLNKPGASLVFRKVKNDFKERIK